MKTYRDLIADAKRAVPEVTVEDVQGRLARGEVVAAAIHLHRMDGDDEDANSEAVSDVSGLHDAVVIAFARRERKEGAAERACRR